jgi:hypothetical protein
MYEILDLEPMFSPDALPARLYREERETQALVMVQALEEKGRGD